MSGETSNVLAVARIENLSNLEGAHVVFEFEPERGSEFLTITDNGRELLVWFFDHQDDFRGPPGLSMVPSNQPGKGPRQYEIHLRFYKTSYRELEALTTKFCELMGWNRVSAPFTSVTVCYNCDQVIHETHHVRMSILHKDKAPEAPCKYQLCAPCQRQVCNAFMRRDKHQEALWNNSDETFECGCSACKKDGL